MRRLFIVVGLWCVIADPSMSFAADLDKIEPPAADWSGAIFEPSFNFPTTPPPFETHAWDGIDFRKDMDGYMRALLAYVMEGQNLQTWRIQDNTVRQWYHVPWMGPGSRGREFINGLTREKESNPQSLGAGQTNCMQNWAVGFYNSAGGYTIGQIWNPVRNDTGEPDLSKLPFAPGTVVAKLLFTEADDTQLPRLKGAPQFTANITAGPQGLICPPPTGPRGKYAKLNLLQLDVAVRDKRADGATGWIFGTFVFDGRLAGSDPWKKLVPVGLMWGNDFDLDDVAGANGTLPRESVAPSTFDFPRPNGFGRSHRTNGPIDNPASACLSCHMTSQWPNPASVTAPVNQPWSVVSCWFRNLSPSTPFGSAPSATEKCGDPINGKTPVSLDYSLQLGVALRNWHAQPKVLKGMQPEVLETLTTKTHEIDNRLNETLIIDGIPSLPIHR